MFHLIRNFVKKERIYFGHIINGDANIESRYGHSIEMNLKNGFVLFDRKKIFLLPIKNIFEDLFDATYIYKQKETPFRKELFCGKLQEASKEMNICNATFYDYLLKNKSLIPEMWAKATYQRDEYGNIVYHWSNLPIFFLGTVYKIKKQSPNLPVSDDYNYCVSGLRYENTSPEYDPAKWQDFTMPLTGLTSCENNNMFMSFDSTLILDDVQPEIKELL